MLTSTNVTNMERQQNLFHNFFSKMWVFILQVFNARRLNNAMRGDSVMHTHTYGSPQTDMRVLPCAAAMSTPPGPWTTKRSRSMWSTCLETSSPTPPGQCRALPNSAWCRLCLTPCLLLAWNNNSPVPSFGDVLGEHMTLKWAIYLWSTLDQCTQWSVMLFLEYCNLGQNEIYFLKF